MIASMVGMAARIRRAAYAQGRRASDLPRGEEREAEVSSTNDAGLGD